jgi:redox-sensitive bicupin YhaK (pirin superfamily)
MAETIVLENERKIRQAWQSQATMEGAGVRLKRAFGFRETPRLDPFLLLDAFHSENPDDYRRGFPWHPHRGIETITYILDGEVEHGDSMGNRGLISAGDVQWMTAGSGIIHQEMPKGGRKGEMWGFQLWSNLPARSKMMEPRYQEVKQSQIPVVKTSGGATVRVIAGEAAGVRGPVREIVTDPLLLDVSLPLGKIFTQPVAPRHNAFAYVIEGEALFETAAPGKAPESYGEGALILFGEGEHVMVSAAERSVRFLLAAGKPLREPIAWYGPVVMNTQAEIKAAFEEFEKGTFVKNRDN